MRGWGWSFPSISVKLGNEGALGPVGIGKHQDREALGQGSKLKSKIKLEGKRAKGNNSCRAMSAGVEHLLGMMELVLTSNDEFLTCFTPLG